MAFFEGLWGAPKSAKPEGEEKISPKIEQYYRKSAETSINQLGQLINGYKMAKNMPYMDEVEREQAEQYLNNPHRAAMDRQLNPSEPDLYPFYLRSSKREPDDAYAEFDVDLADKLIDAQLKRISPESVIEFYPSKGQGLKIFYKVFADKIPGFEWDGVSTSMTPEMANAIRQYALPLLEEQVHKLDEEKRRAVKQANMDKANPRDAINRNVFGGPKAEQPFALSGLDTMLPGIESQQRVTVDLYEPAALIETPGYVNQGKGQHDIRKSIPGVEGTVFQNGVYMGSEKSPAFLIDDTYQKTMLPAIYAGAANRIEKLKKENPSNWGQAAMPEMMKYVDEVLPMETPEEFEAWVNESYERRENGSMSKTTIDSALLNKMGSPTTQALVLGYILEGLKTKGVLPVASIHLERMTNKDGGHAFLRVRGSRGANVVLDPAVFGPKMVTAKTPELSATQREQYFPQKI